MDPAEVMNKIMDKFTVDNVSYVCVSEEEHADGTPHLHALVCLKEKCDIRNATDLDSLGGKHGNYQAAKKVRQCLDYVKKGGKFVEKGEAPSSAKDKITSQMAEAIRNGQSLEQVDEMDPGYTMTHLKQLESYMNFHSRKRHRTSQPRPPLILHRWKTCFEIGVPREHKQKQYWIYGPPNTGKTSLVLDLLQEGFRGFQIPENNDFSAYDDYYDFAYMDEFTGQIAAHSLNQWLEGTPMWLNTKGGSREKRKNLPTFIISNLPPDRVYWKIPQEILTALLVRLIIIQTQ